MDMSRMNILVHMKLFLEQRTVEQRGSMRTVWNCDDGGWPEGESKSAREWMTEPDLDGEIIKEMYSSMARMGLH